MSLAHCDHYGQNEDCSCKRLLFEQTNVINDLEEKLNNITKGCHSIKIAIDLIYNEVCCSNSTSTDFIDHKCKTVGSSDADEQKNSSEFIKDKPNKITKFSTFKILRLLSSKLQTMFLKFEHLVTEIDFTENLSRSLFYTMKDNKFKHMETLMQPENKFLASEMHMVHLCPSSHGADVQDFCLTSCEQENSKASFLPSNALDFYSFHKNKSLENIAHDDSKCLPNSQTPKIGQIGNHKLFSCANQIDTNINVPISLVQTYSYEDRIVCSEMKGSCGEKSESVLTTICKPIDSNDVPVILCSTQDKNGSDIFLEYLFDETLINVSTSKLYSPDQNSLYNFQKQYSTADATLQPVNFLSSHQNMCHSVLPYQIQYHSKNQSTSNFATFCGTSDACQNKESLIQKAKDNLQCITNSKNLAELSKVYNVDKKCYEIKEADLLTAIQRIQDLRNDLEQKLSLLQRQNSDVRSKEEELRKRANFIISKEREEFNQQILTLKAEQEGLLRQVSELKIKVLSAEMKLSQVQNNLVLCISSKEEAVSALEFQLSIEAVKYERALKNCINQDSGLSKLKKQLSDQEQLICSLEDAIAEMILERKTENGNRWQELEEIHLALITRDEECTGLNEDLKKCVAELDEERLKNLKLISQFSEFEAASEKMKTVMEAELSLLRSDSRELRKKLIKLTKEKDVLWKRTDHLTFLQKTQAASRWMQDCEVTNCLGCKTRFSFRNRKHHCRLCGKIFCCSCVSNWLFTAASRYQARVCNDCYVQHMQMKKVVKEGSDVHSITDESEDDDYVVHSTMFLNASSIKYTHATSSIESTPSIPSAFNSTDKSVNQLLCSTPDLPLTSQENRNVTYPQSIFSVRDKCEDIEKNLNFDVITDEEIEKSLSTASPYTPFIAECENQDSISDSGLSLTLTRTTSELKAAGEKGIHGEIWINAGMRSGIPILCDCPPIELQWEFICDPKTVTLTIIFQKKDKSTEILLCNSLPKANDSAVFLRPGLYILLFDNSFSRVKARKVQYTLRSVQDQILNDATAHIVTAVS